jgi:hypothetical protein
MVMTAPTTTHTGAAGLGINNVVVVNNTPGVIYVGGGGVNTNGQWWAPAGNPGPQGVQGPIGLQGQVGPHGDTSPQITLELLKDTKGRYVFATYRIVDYDHLNSERGKPFSEWCDDNDIRYTVNYSYSTTTIRCSIAHFDEDDALAMNMRWGS